MSKKYVIPLAKLISYYSNLEAIVSILEEKLAKVDSPIPSNGNYEEIVELKEAIGTNKTLLKNVVEFFRVKAIELTEEEAYYLLGDLLQNAVDAGIVRGNKIYL